MGNSTRWARAVRSGTHAPQIKIAIASLGLLTGPSSIINFDATKTNRFRAEGQAATGYASGNEKRGWVNTRSQSDGQERLRGAERTPAEHVSASVTIEEAVLCGRPEADNLSGLIPLPFWFCASD